MNNNDGNMSIRTWSGMGLFMLIGSLAASVGNMFLNTFLNDCVFDEGSMGAGITLTDAVNIMVTFSSVVSVVTAFIMGTLSEKMKNRKAFISFGYIAWGIITVLFGFVSKENISELFGINDSAKVVFATAWTVVIFNMIMTFTVATSNDSAFNSWVTDMTPPRFTPVVEALFTGMGFVASGIIMIFISNAQGGKISYSTCFILIGLFVAAVGVGGLRLLDNPKKFENSDPERNKTSYWSDLFYGFRPSTIKENSGLYLILLMACLFNSAYQSFFPYLIIYLGSVVVPANKDIELTSFGVIFTLIISILVIVYAESKLLKKVNRKRELTFMVSVICYAAGLFILSQTKNIFGIIAGIAPLLIGYIFIMIHFGASVRDNIPQDKVGLFQGIRLIFQMLIPMIVGPTLGNIAAKNSNVTYMENGAEKVLPTENMFLYAAVLALLIFVPMIPFFKKDRERRIIVETAEFQQRNNKKIKNRKQSRKDRKNMQNK